MTVLHFDCRRESEWTVEMLDRLHKSESTVGMSDRHRKSESTVKMFDRRDNGGKHPSPAVAGKWYKGLFLSTLGLFLILIHMYQLLS